MPHSIDIHSLILGSGGHAKVVAETISENDSCEGFAFLDRDESLWGSDIWGIPV